MRATPVTSKSPPKPVLKRRRLLDDETGDLRIANARLKALIDIGLELAAERDPNRLLHSVCAGAREVFGATFVTLGILDANDRTVQRFITCGPDATCGIDGASWIKTGDPVSGILATVVAERRPLRGDNPGGDPARLPLPPFHPEVRAFLAAPIASPSRVYGWICLVGNEGRSFTENDEHLMMALSGQVGRIYELESEILERKQAELDLRHERDRAQRYLDTAEVILLALDLDGRITLINRKGCDLLGWTADELLGRNWVEMCVPPRIRDGLRKKLHDVIGGGPSTAENPIVTKSGEERPIEWHNTVLRDDAGQIVGTFSSGKDVSVRNQAVEALRTAEERLRYALEASGVGIWDMDFTTGVIQCSAILESQYGMQPGTFRGTFEAAIEHVHPDDRESVRKALGKARRSGADFSILNRSLWPDGTVRWLAGAGRILLDEHGEPVRGIGISQDVTERRTLEEQYQQAQKMEAIGRLAGGVAHDFNNLLTAILGYCELLLPDLDPADPRHADIAEIRKAGMRGAALTRQLLAFSRKEVIEPTRLDLNVVVADMRPMLGRLIREDVLVVLGQWPEPALIMADRGQVDQVVMNLAVNAQDAMPDGGTLTIEIANVELDERYAKAHLGVTPGRHAVLTVSDTGTGMTPQVLARLFEPFFTTKAVGKGTGLGLATVDGIVARSGGSVSVHSELGKGTSFKVYFPWADAASTVVDVPPLVVRPRAGAETVLVVDDADELRELTRRLLERQGYTVLVAANAADALQLFERNPSIDVLLTDVVMPGASGPELTKQLVEHRPGLKVLYMSGYADDVIAQHGVLNPGIAFLPKPFTSETLGRKLREVLDR